MKAAATRPRRPANPTWALLRAALGDAEAEAEALVADAKRVDEADDVGRVDVADSMTEDAEATTELVEASKLELALEAALEATEETEAETEEGTGAVLEGPAAVEEPPAAELLEPWPTQLVSEPAWIETGAE